MNTKLSEAMNAAQAKSREELKGMNPEQHTEQVAKEAEGKQIAKAVQAELAETTPESDGTEVASTRDYTFSFADGKVTPSSFQEHIKDIAPALADALPDFVDRTYFSTWTDMFRIANLINIEYGIQPGFDDAGRAWQAANAPEAFAFDKDTAGYTESHESEGVLQPMSWQEIAAKRAEGLRPMSNSQWVFYEETATRVLNGMAILHALKDLGYESQHKAEDVWQAAREAEHKRQQNYQDRQELEGRRKAEASQKALQEAKDNGSLVL